MPALSFIYGLKGITRLSTLRLAFGYTFTEAGAQHTGAFLTAPNFVLTVAAPFRRACCVEQGFHFSSISCRRVVEE